MEMQKEERQELERLRCRVVELEQALETLEQRSGWFATLFDEAPDPIFMETLDDRIVDANRAASQIFGYSREELLGMTVADLQAPEVRGELGTIIREELTRGDCFEGLNLHRDGRLVPVEVHNRLVTVAGRELVLSIVRDISNRKAIEAELLRAEKTLTRAFSDSPLMLTLSAVEDCRLIEVNEAFSRIIGFSHAEIVGRTAVELGILGESDYQALVERLQLDGRVRELELELRRADGSELLSRYTGEIIEIDGQRRLLSMIEDVSDQYRTERDLRLYETIVSASPDPMAVIDRDYRYLLVNRSYERFWGKNREQLLGRRVEEVLGTEVFVSTVKERVDRCLAGEIVRYSAWFSSPSYGERFMELNYCPFRNRDGSVAGLINLAHDLTEPKRAEDSLRESEERFRLLIESAPVAVMLIRGGRYIYANPRGRQMLGYEYERDIVGMEALATIAPEHHQEVLERIEQARQGRANPPLEMRLLRADGGSLWTMSASVPIKLQGEPAVVVVGQDVTELRRMTEEKERLEEEYRQAQKLESIGRLAGGIAHDLNNLLAPILGYGEMLVEDCGANDPRHTAAREVVSAAGRAADLVRQLLAFSRKQALEFSRVDLIQVLTNFGRLIERMLREDIRLELELPPALPPLYGDVGQLEQIVMNLAVNGQDAMPEGGVLTIRAWEPAEHPERVAFSVADTGCGIEAEVVERIFEPFFTTKEKGKGTGMGLATVYGIVEQHHGKIEVDSMVGRGTVFTILLPVADEDAAVPVTESDPEATAHHPHRVLVVEDEPQLREMIRRALLRRGYRVGTAASAEEALALLTEGAASFDLLVTDVVMPGLDGRQLAEQAVTRRPQLKVLYISGYIDDEVVRRGIMEHGGNFLRKPFTLRELEHTVIEILATS